MRSTKHETRSTLRRHLDTGPLPTTSPKAAQLDAWAELVALRHGVIGTGHRGALGRSEAIVALVDELGVAKRYQGRHLLCACPPEVGADGSS